MHQPPPPSSNSPASAGSYASSGAPRPASATTPPAADALESSAETTSAQPQRRHSDGPDRRESVVDRRCGIDRRVKTREESGYTGPERRSGVDRRAVTGLERRRGPGRRRSDLRKAAEEGEMTAEQFEFVMAIETYKKVNKKMFPTWTEVLEVITQLGYRKVQTRTIKLENVPEPDLTAKVA